MAGLIFIAGMAVAALYGMLVWRWLPYIGCWFDGGSLIWDAGLAVAAFNSTEYVLLCASDEVAGLI